MNETKINITVMPGAQMNGYVKEQNNYFGTVQQVSCRDAEVDPIVDVEEAKTVEPNHHESNGVVREPDEELFHFVHPELNDAEAWCIHYAVKRFVAHNRVIDICNYLKQLKDRGKILLPQSPTDAYNELVRMGMPKGEGYGEKHFSAKYKK